MTLNEESLNLHKQKRGKIRIQSTVPVKTKNDLSKIYSPGVAAPSKAIQHNPETVHTYTSKERNVAIVTDGTAVLGLGDIGPEASIPVMEGKAALLKRFADLDGYPLPLQTTSAEETTNIIKAITPYYNAINLEDIKAPQCFDILHALKDLPIPVFHDDQHGTAMVILTALINAYKITPHNKHSPIVINSAGAAGIATADLLHKAGHTNITVLDSKGVLTPTRTDLNKHKARIAKQTNPNTTTLEEAIHGAATFIGVSVADILSQKHVEAMQSDPVIFALANPAPEINPHKAKQAGAKIIATGRSDYPNQVNNALIFPGLFKGLIENQRNNLELNDMIHVSQALADLIKPQPENILPDVFNPDVVPTITQALKR